MSRKKKVLAICGSTRKLSANLSLLNIIKEMTSGTLDMVLFKALTDIPHFNPDIDIEPAPPQVAAFRKLVKEADGVLICTPEYAMGVPGTLKNAFDWLVSSAELSHKPVVLITASSQGYEGHASLLKTLRIIECHITDQMQLVIPFIKTKISGEKITDQKTLDEISNVLAAFNEALDPGKPAGTIISNPLTP